MIKVLVKRNAEGNIHALTVEGHSGYAEHGQDIVCAGVSALMQMIPIALSSLDKTAVEHMQESGSFRVSVSKLPNNEANMKAAFLMDSVLRTLLEMQKSYEGFIEIIE